MDDVGTVVMYDEGKKEIKEEKKGGWEARKQGKGKYGCRLWERALN